MSTQPLRRERFAQGPPLQRLLDLPAVDEFKSGSGTPTGRAPKPSREPQLADGDGAPDHRQGGPFDRLVPAAWLAGDPQQEPMPSSGLHRDKAGRRGWSERSVHVRTRALALPGRWAPPPDRRCPYRTPAPPDARTGIGTDTTDPRSARSAVRRRSGEDPSERRGRIPGYRSARQAGARSPGQCLPATSAAHLALSRSAPIQPTDPASL